jgi:hypothetical protein
MVYSLYQWRDLCMRNRKKNIRDIIRTLLESRFDDVEIVSVNVRPDLDTDGDPVLFITIVFDGKKKQLDPRKTSGLVRRLLPKMKEAGEEGFPVFSFIAKSELGKIKPDAA